MGHAARSHAESLRVDESSCLPPASMIVKRAPARRTADILVDVLVDAGVEVIFGLPGGPIAPIHDALLDRPEIRVVTTRHEAGALFAAAGYAQATGKLAVVVVTSGPGILNTVTGLASAFCEGLPVLVIAGEVPRDRYGKGAAQDGTNHGLDVIHMVRSITKFAAEAIDANTAPGLLKRAIATACSGRRGPALVTLPMDVSTAHGRPPVMEVGSVTTFTPAAANIDAAAAALVRASS